MGQFRDYVLRAPFPEQQDMTVETVLHLVILYQIYLERQGDIIDKGLIRSCIYMLEGLYETEEQEEAFKLYLTRFEPLFLERSRAFYESEGSSLLVDTDAGTFCKQVRRRVVEEEDRCRSTISTLTSAKIKMVIENELIKRNIRAVIGLESSGVKSMLDNDRFHELEMIYELVSKVDPTKSELKKAIQARIEEQGKDINKNAMAPPQQPTNVASKADGEKTEGEGDNASAKPTNMQTAAAIKWVDDVLELKSKYDLVLLLAFQSDQSLQTAFARSFTEFINDFNRSSENLSLFFDENMKKGIKGKTENEVDLLLDKGITLLRYIQDKDMFERYYKKHLSKRLLMKRSVSMDAERQMISKMKMEVGNTFTQRIESMFKDMAVSEDLSANYKRHVQEKRGPDPHRAELDVNVLTSTMWPLEAMNPSHREGEPRSTCVLPREIESVRQGFERFYLDKHSGRQLTWQTNMGTADIRAHFPGMKGPRKTRDLNVSTYAMIILLLFNKLPSGQHLTCEEIQATTNIPHNELTRNLQALAVAPKTRVLVKEPMSKDIKPKDKFYFNENFQSPFQRIKVLVVANANRAEDFHERQETEKKNNDTRGVTIEAAIVRIMKSVIIPPTPPSHY